MGWWPDSVHSNSEVLQKPEEEDSYFPHPRWNSIEELEEPPLGSPLPEHSAEGRDDCALVTSCKWQPAFWAALASVVSFHGCPGQWEKGVVKMGLIQPGRLHEQDLNTKGSFVPDGRNACSKVAERIMTDLKFVMACAFINFDEMGILCIFELPIKLACYYFLGKTLV